MTNLLATRAVTQGCVITAIYLCINFFQESTLKAFLYMSDLVLEKVLFSSLVLSFGSFLCSCENVRQLKVRTTSIVKTRNCKVQMRFSKCMASLSFLFFFPENL